MYSFLFDPAYINMFILALLIFLVMFLWRKLTILEGNFFILEKRVNLVKKETRESSLARNLEKSNIVMNEIFSDSIPDTISQTVGTCSFPLSNSDDIPQINNINEEVVHKDESKEYNDGVKISFTNNAEIDKKLEETIDPLDIINAIDKIDHENDTVSITSDLTFNTEDKYTQKKLSKMNLDKLKEVCMQLNISNEGTKSQLVSRILENSK